MKQYNQNHMIQSLIKAQECFINNRHSDEVYTIILDEIVQITKSSFGFIGEVFEKDGQKELRMEAYSKNTFLHHSSKKFMENIPNEVVFKSFDNLFGEAILYNKPVISNKLKDDTRAKGTPKGHPKLQSFMGIPIALDNKVIGLICVANASQKYNEILFEILKPLLQTIGHMIEAKKNENIKNEAVSKLIDSEEKYRIFVDHSSDFLYLKDAENRYMIVNKNLVDFFNKPVENIIGKTDYDLMDKHYAKVCELSDKKVLQINKTQISEEIIGDKIFETTKFPVEYHGKTVIGGVIRDVTEYKKAKDQIYHLSFYDTITKLPNRQLFNEYISGTLKNSQFTLLSGALVLVDLDHFKHLNDSKGHKVGDELLVQMGHFLKDLVSDSTVVARFGGDAFGILLEDVNINPIKVVKYVDKFCKKIFKKLKKPFLLSNQTIEYTASLSIGVTILDGQEKFENEVYIKQAEIALFKSKERGRGCVTYFDDKMQSQVDNKISIDNLIRKSLKNNTFELFYQPQVNSLGELIGLEALIRCRYCDKYIPPSDFIPYAEETNLIVEIGKRVIQMACEQINTWSNHKYLKEIPIAINISTKQFQDPLFIEILENECDKYKVSYEQLKLEITETILMDNSEEANKKIDILKSLGFKISMDDFGTGYSSLSYLRQLQPDQIKIDRSFVLNILSNKDDLILVETLIALGEKLGIEVLAEGVEDVEQLELLHKKSSSLSIQGYLYSKPLEVKACEQLFKNGKIIEYKKQ